jgi:hypothetical protein
MFTGMKTLAAALAGFRSTLFDTSCRAERMARSGVSESRIGSRDDASFIFRLTFSSSNSIYKSRCDFFEIANFDRRI